MTYLHAILAYFAIAVLALLPVRQCYDHFLSYVAVELTRSNAFAKALFDADTLCVGLSMIAAFSSFDPKVA
jgi:uncharacterized membrane protein YjfL (UPF0719 family)